MTFFNCYLGMLLHSMKVEAHHRLDAKSDQIFLANFKVNKNLKNFKLKANETKSNGEKCVDRNRLVCFGA